MQFEHDGMNRRYEHAGTLQAGHGMRFAVPFAVGKHQNGEGSVPFEERSRRLTNTLKVW